eukprot:CAMPEP_0115066094 /NCGR_PEP_ID=MMETSP0227-20121206/10619_1 /TAXON_ID=89957 /ORGANISM="Polarella glacialis, Strain CCMP 1383" /LENGTH=406 /DNA_ID=CAMNT_0002451963 /DNA_START=102 /DNA_END=1322 /DNA_ORIENTATION=-
MDARYTHRGQFSAWLIKSASDGGSTAKWLQSLSRRSRRYFTIDFDKKLFYYSHGESREKAAQISTPLHFWQIHGASPGHINEDEEQASGLMGSLSNMIGSRRPPPPGVFPFTVRTTTKRLRLEAEVESEIFQWIAMLNAASRIGSGVGFCGSLDEALDDSAAIPRGPSPESLPDSSRSAHFHKPRSETSEIEKGSEDSTADGEENASESCGLLSPTAVSEVGLPEAGQDIAASDAEEPEEIDPSSCSLSKGSACSEASGFEAPSGPGRPTRSLQAADFGFDEDDSEGEARGEETPAESPVASPRAHCPLAAEEAACWSDGNEGEVTRAVPEAIHDNERMAADLLLLQNQQQAAAARQKHRSKGGERCDENRAHQPQEEKAQDARVAADLMLLQVQAARRLPRAARA